MRTSLSGPNHQSLWYILHIQPHHTETQTVQAWTWIYGCSDFARHLTDTASNGHLVLRLTQICDCVQWHNHFRNVSLNVPKRRPYPGQCVLQHLQKVQCQSSGKHWLKLVSPIPMSSAIMIRILGFVGRVVASSLADNIGGMSSIAKRGWLPHANRRSAAVMRVWGLWKFIRMMSCGN